MRARLQAGDTIVEVLIVLAILGLAFTISYATANHSLLASRTAEEHSEALQVLDSQVELLRQAASNNTDVFLEDGAFCMTLVPTGSPPQLMPTPTYPTHPYFAVPPVANDDDLSEYPAPCVNGLYHLSVEYVVDPVSGAKDVFTVRVRWEPLSGNQIQQEYITYKLHGTGSS